MQQFFEALGLTPPPKVEINTHAIHLSGAAGERLDYVIQVATPEKRPVYAHGTSDQPWLKVGRANLKGQSASLPIVVSEVPDRPGERLQAQVTVVANGNQRFPVVVTLAVEKRSAPRRPQPEFELVTEEEPAPVAAVATAVAAVPVAIPATSPVARATTRTRTVRGRGPWRRSRSLPADCRRGAPGAGRGAAAGSALRAWGRFLARPPEPPPVSVPVVDDSIDPNPLIEVKFHDKETPITLSVGGSVKPGAPMPEGETTPAVWDPTMRFGVVMKGVDGGKPKQLTRRRPRRDEQHRRPPG